MGMETVIDGLAATTLNGVNGQPEHEDGVCLNGHSLAPTGPSELIVIDLEATCDPSDDSLTRLEQCAIHEIIEFPAVRISRETLAEVDYFHAFVRPTEHTELSKFCTELTGITQAQVDESAPLQEVLGQLMQWFDERGLIDALRDGRAVLVAHGLWDLLDMLPAECNRKGLPLPECMTVFADLQAVFSEAQGVGSGLGMLRMLERLGLEREGRHHSGLDDSRNLARVAARLLEQGADFTPTHRHGVQVRCQGITMRHGDWACINCQAAVFGSKENCFRCGAPRPAGAPAPPPSTARRPGDWDCPACSAVVFASKLQCFRCNAPRPGNLPRHSAAENGRHSETRPGDWTCPNCTANVYASKMACFRCGTPRPMMPMCGYGVQMCGGYGAFGPVPAGYPPFGPAAVGGYGGGGGYGCGGCCYVGGNGGAYPGAVNGQYASPQGACYAPVPPGYGQGGGFAPPPPGYGPSVGYPGAPPPPNGAPPPPNGMGPGLAPRMAGLSGAANGEGGADEDSAEETMYIASRLVGRLIGKGGAAIQELRGNSGAPPRSPRSPPSPRPFPYLSTLPPLAHRATLRRNASPSHPPDPRPTTQICRCSHRGAPR